MHPGNSKYIKHTPAHEHCAVLHDRAIGVHAVANHLQLRIMPSGAPSGAIRPRRPARPASLASWVIVGTTVLLCFAVVPRLRDAAPQGTRALAKRALTIAEDEVGTAFALDTDNQREGSSGSLLHIPYEAMFEATPAALRTLCVAFFILVLLFLFCSISITASDFFCPNLASMAAYLGLSETTAGVTLLAFGNGSPDVFSTFVAMREGTFGLAAGELIGAASFITSIVVGSIAMVKPFHVPRYAFLRDVSFFMVAVLLFMWALADGHLTLRESGAMIGLYVLYVAVVICGNWWQRRQRRKEDYAQLGWKTMPRDEEEATPTPDAISDAHLVPPPPAPTPPSFTPGRFGRRASSASLNAQLAANEAADVHPMSQSAHLLDTEGDTPRAGFSLLGAVEFRDVVNALRQSGELPASGSSSRHPSRPATPVRSPLHESADSDYFHHSHRTKHQRHSSMQGLAVVERRVSMTRSRSGSLHPAWIGRSRQSTLDDTPGPSPLSPLAASPPQPGGDPDVEHIPMAASPRNKHNLTLDIPPPELTTVIASITPMSAASEVPQIALHDEDGEEAEPMMPLSRKTTVEIVARKSLGAMRIVIHTLFPSLQGFRHKSLLGMGLAVLSVPAIFILTLTLPVIDDGRGDEGGLALPGDEDEPLMDATENDSGDDEDHAVRREISGELHHLVENGYPHRRRSVDADSASSCSACSEEDDCMAFNPTLTAAQCFFGPVVCGYLVFRTYLVPLSKLTSRGRAVSPLGSSRRSGRRVARCPRSSQVRDGRLDAAVAPDPVLLRLHLQHGVDRVHSRRGRIRALDLWRDLWPERCDHRPDK